MNQHLRALYALLVTIPLLVPRFADGQEWPRFRGPNGAGQAESRTVPVSWTPAECRWRVTLPGIGYSSPVINGKHVFVTCADEKKGTRFIRCYTLTDGKLVWNKTYPGSTYRKNKDCSYASSTPALDKTRVFTTWATPEEYLVLALDQATGRELWRRDLGPFKFVHGVGASPIVYRDLLIVPDDQERGGTSRLVALDTKTGAVRWQIPRKSSRTAYSTPCLLTSAGGPEQLIVASTPHGISSHNPLTGNEYWEIELDPKQRVVASPVIAAGLIVASAGSGGRGKRQIAVRPGNPKTGAPPTLAYELKGGLPYVPTPLAANGLLFTWGDQGLVKCVDAATGKLYWQHRLGAAFYGSPVRVGNRLYCASRGGEMFVLAVAKEFRQLARFELGESSFSTPAVAHGMMVIRTRSHLFAVGG